MSNTKTALPFNPKTLISLWDMMRVFGDPIFSMLTALNDFHKAAYDEFMKFGPSALYQYKEPTRETLIISLKLCRELHFNKSAVRIERLIQHGLRDNQLASVIQHELFTLRMEIIDEAKSLNLILIPPDKIHLFEQAPLFGKPVFDAFEDATPEIKNAGICMGMELHDAAMFHLMRTAEHGLRALAKHLKVRLKYPLEYADWGTIISELDKKLDVLQSKKRGKKKTDALEFYRIMVSECNMLKDVWRNSVMHTRKRFNEPEVLGACERVKDFMQRLATFS